MTEFTPVAAVLGGVLIGTAAAILLLLNGRVAGISGIIGSSLTGDRNDRAWRIAFLLGLPIGAASIGLLQGGLPSEVSAAPWALIAAGLLVGIGTQVGSGCTSGHGVCGMSRGSKRSILATLTFMASGAATVFVVRQVVGAGL